MSEATLEKIVDTLSELKVLDLANLKTMLEDKWGVKAAAAAVAAPAAAGAAPAAAAEESTEFDITLKSIDASKKIAAIKAVRKITGLGLKEAKEAVEGAPTPLKQGASKAEADEAMKELADAGCVGELKGL
ncbi:MAG: 50S ribosomal protein L7/L12 [Chlamydiia bacterium]|nr:50S ribosomal protein L7/L12 [Chlamydiia bacterium]MCH9618621.1 50S ribosomal protein L7/L12 [Chlamydiia bacterium]MCH9624341.1 50S ribosomal protein L7/L12 [Chlamydiia bacterium]